MQSIDMIIFCHRCGVQHVDEPSPGWDNPPHRTHECQHCEFKFRVADVPTNGVRELKTVGTSDDEKIRGVQNTGRMQCVREFGIDPGGDK